jgi:tRNA A-37 threonylcarbamoyl transferase component Bud32
VSEPDTHADAAGPQRSYAGARGRSGRRGESALIGTHLDPYEILDKVGEGGMATVYRGRHANLGREVAIKVLHPHLSSSVRNRQRFAREARAIEHLRHPNILEIFDYSGVDADDCYIVTEFVPGHTLTELVARVHRVPSEVAAVIGLALAEALAAAHRSGVLHRDLKPDNVMVRVDGRVKLMDFGIARFLDETQVTMTGALVGSPAFMSPEQARESDLDARSDLFSLGTLLFYLVSGELPFAGSNPSLILKNIIEGRRPAVTELLPCVNPRLADVIERLLSTRREDRFPSASTTAVALREALDEVGFDPDAERWALQRYLLDPAAYEADLDAWLREALIPRARALMDDGDALAALRLANRLLSLEEDHPEALALVQGFHGLTEPARSAPAGRGWVVALAALGLGLGAVVWWLSPAPQTPVEGASVPSAPREAVAALAREAPAAGAPGDLAGAAGAPDDAVRAEASVPPADPTTADPSKADPRTADPSKADAAASDRSIGPRGDVVAGDGRGPLTPTTPATTPAPVGGAARSASDGPATSPSSASLPPATAAVQPPRPSRPARATPADPAARDGRGCVEVRTAQGHADVYLEDMALGTTRSPGCFDVPAGAVTLTLRSPVYEPQTLTVQVADEGVTRVTGVQLVKLPARVIFSRDRAGGCAVSVDGTPAGTLSVLGWTLSLERPDLRHEVRLSCPEGTWVQVFSDLRHPDARFEGAAVATSAGP